MQFWEDFFSTEKIIYAAIGSLLAGILIFILSIISDREFNEIALGFFMGMGFLAGNMIKIKKIENKREIEKLMEKERKRNIRSKKQTHKNS